MTEVDERVGHRMAPAGRGPRPVVLGVLLLLALAVLGAVLLWPRDPGDDSAEAGFARDMSEHHAQGVAMALTTLEASEDPDVVRLAYDIATTQSSQIGQMDAWLRSWDLPLARAGDRMAWMEGLEGGHSMPSSETGTDADMDGMGGEPGSPDYRAMPGMASQAELDALDEAQGDAADVLFLQLMTTHHIAGVEMAEVALDASGDPEVTRLAQAMVNAQRSEIDLMVMLLEELDAEPREDLATLDLGSGL